MKNRARAGDRRENADSRDRRLSVLLWAVLFSLICGAIEFGQPLEDLIQAGRDVVRSRDSKIDAVVVAIDDKTAKELGGIDFPRRVDAQTVDKLFAMGARRVFFDRAYADPTTPAEDATFISALKRHTGRVFLGVISIKDTRTKQTVEIGPRREFMKAAQLTSLNGKITPFSLSARIPYNGTLDGKRVRSMSTVLANVDVQSWDHYRPDWAIQARSIPTYSLVDIIRGRIPESRIANHDVVISTTATSFNDIHHIASQGWIPGVYFQVIGAETLKRGHPANWGWVPAYLIGLGLAVVHLYTRRMRVVWLTASAAIVLLGIFPIYLDEKLVTVDIVPAGLLFAIIAYRATTLRRVLRSSQTNVVSGLPNLAALRYAGKTRPQTLIALKMRNYSEIAASFNQLIERAVIDEIRRRVVLSGDDGEMFHSEDTLLWFSDLPMGEDLAHHLEGLKAILSTALPIDGREIDISVSFGVDADHQRPMTSRIGSAMLCAEEAARGNDIWKFYDPERLHEAAWQLSLLSRLDQAVDTGEVWVAFQPKLDVKSDRIVGAEALVRWSHPERGLIGPDDFISVAEKHNRIEKLTGFVLDQAVAAAAQINEQGTDFVISANLSVQLLQKPDLLNFVDRILKKYNFPASKLILEITETGKLDRNGSGIAMMRSLVEHGIKVSIDDYGTGNATLDYLKILPSHEVKIDKQFVADIDTNHDDLILVGSTIRMVHSLGRKVVADGVETQSILRALSRLGCDMVQGYLIGKPMKLPDLIDQIFSQDRRAANGN
ncbi:MAG: EAL domain-containing protein [Sphingomonadales bacterium]|nr:EAL domain-containing protein [Sphingomonadales bacterium]